MVMTEKVLKMHTNTHTPKDYIPHHTNSHILCFLHHLFPFLPLLLDILPKMGEEAAIMQEFTSHL